MDESAARTMLYANCRLPRSGLANKLFVWARFILFCERVGAIPLSYSFTSIRIGSILRREKDKRTYLGVFRSDRLGAVHGLRKLLIRSAAARISELDYLTIQQLKVSGPLLVEFSRTSETFAPLNGHHSLVRRRLEEITQQRWLDRVLPIGSIDIAVHVRLGDFGSLKHPIEWYLDTLRGLREELGYLRCAIFTDGFDHELHPLLEEPNVHLVRTGSAISDLLSMSRAKLLIGTGSSTFTAWAAYLGQMPVIVRKENPLSWFSLEAREGQYHGTLSDCSFCVLREWKSSGDFRNSSRDEDT